MKQFAIIARDGEDAEALERRLAARKDHLDGAKVLKDHGNFVFGGAILNEQGGMCGSIMIVQFEDETSMMDWYRSDPYVLGKVWERVEILPFKTASI